MALATTVTYAFNRGDGQDTINDYGYSCWYGYGGADAVVFGAGIKQSDLFVYRTGNNLVVRVRDNANPAADDRITIEDWFSSDTYKIEQFCFVDGSTLSAAQLTVMGDVIYGTEGDDSLAGFSEGNRIYGLAGNDTISFSSCGNSTIDGGAGDDTIQVDSRYYSYPWMSNVIAGGTGNDRIVSGGTADTYAFNRGDGQDTINDYGYSCWYGYGGADAVVLGEGIAADQLWFRRVGNNLELDVIGTSDSIAIEDWYANSFNQIETLRSGDARTLVNAQVEALVQAMASMTPPPIGQLTLPDETRNVLAPLLAASWQ